MNQYFRSESFNMRINSEPARVKVLSADDKRRNDIRVSIERKQDMISLARELGCSVDDLTL